MIDKAHLCAVFSCAVAFVDGSVSLSVSARLTMVDEARPFVVVLGVPLFVVTVMRAC